MAKLEVLDVGHGNCALVTGDSDHAVVDAPLGDLLVSLLLERGIERIGAVVVSHADADHLGGVQALLYDERIKVDRLYVNPEQKRTSKVWETFKVAALAAEINGTIIKGATRGDEITVSDVTLQILSPTGGQGLAGACGKIGKKLYSANRLSIVVRVMHNNIGRVLLPADMDGAALDDIVASNVGLSADVLVFPHHGGHSNANSSEFTDKLLKATQASHVVFSLGHWPRNPLPAIVNGVRTVGVSLCCTGLSSRCQPDASRGSSCAGTVTIDLRTGSWNSREDKRHQNYVSTQVEEPLCRGPLDVDASSPKAAGGDI